MDLKKYKPTWFSQFQHPLYIAGPCSAESEQQMLETAQRIKNECDSVPIFRAGIWKPRTKPNGFEGVGEIGLHWLKKVKEEFGFLTATEVANAHHVEAALKAEVDILWIGARSTVNPFTVQEIANSLQGSNKIVLVKNPVNPDLALWVGALERLLAQEINNLGVIHRGFSTYQKSQYRNNPHWQLAIDFKQEFPNIPIIIDPSHICGNRQNLASVTQTAFNLDYDGAMIETHCSPDNAWSDAQQQITPEILGILIQQLKHRDTSLSSCNDEMERHRTLISELDMQLIELLSQRMKISEKIGKLKHDNNILIFQPERWKFIQEYAKIKASETGMTPQFIEKIFKAIHEESIAVQNQLMND